ncbi:MAG: helix-turn-helix domain-containing protein [Anaerolineae bacterium]|nr:helix-turn-helix domain-containing protein [Anaerolineae bacterium]
MKFVFDRRPSDAPLVETIWHTRSAGSGSFMSSAASNIEMVVTQQTGGMWLTVRGPETKASPAPIPEDAEFLGIIFKLGTFVPCLPASELVDGGIHLPEAAGQSFWLHGSAWQFPTFDNADTFVDRLVRQGLLAHDPLVEAALQGELKDVSARSVQRRFRRITGLTPGTMVQIERARRAMTLLQQGVSILDTVEQAGYYDQPHLTRSLKHFIGQTPAQLTDRRRNE